MVGINLSIFVTRQTVEEMVVIPTMFDQTYSIPLFQVCPNLKIDGARMVLSPDRLIPVEPGVRYQIEGPLDISPTPLPSDLLSLNLSRMALVQKDKQG